MEMKKYKLGDIVPPKLNLDIFNEGNKGAPEKFRG